MMQHFVGAMYGKISLLVWVLAELSFVKLNHGLMPFFVNLLKRGSKNILYNSENSLRSGADKHIKRIVKKAFIKSFGFHIVLLLVKLSASFEH